MWDNTKYYKTTRLVRKQTEEIQRKRGHQRLDGGLLTGRVAGTMVVKQPLHIGTGLLVPPQSVGLESDVPLIKSFYQENGRLTIPAASIKGPIRSIVETITYSCVSKTRNRWSNYEKEDYGECRFNLRHREQELCIACRMFGAMGYEGQIYLSDASLESGEVGIHFIPSQHEPKGSRERRHYAHDTADPREPLLPLQVVLPDGRFPLQLTFQNVPPAELGLLLLALGQGDAPLCPKLGAGKNSGLGGVQFADLTVEQVDATALYTSFSSEAAWQPVDIQACLDAAQKELRQDDALGRLQADLGCSGL